MIVCYICNDIAVKCKNPCDKCLPLFSGEERTMILSNPEAALMARRLAHVYRQKEYAEGVVVFNQKQTDATIKELREQLKTMREEVVAARENERAMAKLLGEHQRAAKERGSESNCWRDTAHMQEARSASLAKQLEATKEKLKEARQKQELLAVDVDFAVFEITQAHQTLDGLGCPGTSDDAIQVRLLKLGTEMGLTKK